MACDEDKTGEIDYDQVERLALVHKPKMVIFADELLFSTLKD